MIADASVAPAPVDPQMPKAVSSVPLCPVCDRGMVLRTAKKGKTLENSSGDVLRFPNVGEQEVKHNIETQVKISSIS